MASFFQQLASQLQVATLYMQGCGKLHVTYSYRKLENQLTSYTCQFSLCQRAERKIERDRERDRERKREREREGGREREREGGREGEREIAKERMWPLKWAIPEKIQTGGVEDMLF